MDGAGRPTTTVLHVLPHAGGGAETYLRLLADLDGWDQGHLELSAARTPLAAAPSIVSRMPRLAASMRSADLVHVHGDAALLLSLPLLGLAPSVWTTHGLHLLRRRPQLAAPVRGAVRATRATICTSRAEADELAAIAPRLTDRLAVIPNGVALPPSAAPADRVRARAELGLANYEVAALFLGELEPRKRPLDAVAAVEAARAGGAPVTLLVAGRGPLSAAVQGRAGVAVRPLGFRDDPQRLLAAADVFVLPSEREGHSFALLEAMAHGLPVVVSDGAGNPEAVGEAGIVVPVGDVAALTDALGRLAREPSLCAALGDSARARVAAELTPARLREGVREVYRRALRLPAPAGASERA